MIDRIWKVHILSTILNLIVSVVCTIFFGACGPLLGTLVSIFAVQFAAYVYLLLDTFEIEGAALAKSVLFPMATATTDLGCRLDFFPTACQQLALTCRYLGMILAALIVITEYTLVYSRKEKQMWHARIRHLLGFDHK